MITSPLISVIMPAYIAAAFITEDIQSVLMQDYQHWELLIINDGSKDNTGQLIEKFNDPRIRTFHTENRGVSKARNLGLAEMHGDYFAFLDADDVYLPSSLSSRLAVFHNDNRVTFVDGAVEVINGNRGTVVTHYRPDFYGNPRSELLALNGRCFTSVSWMVKRSPTVVYQFPEHMTHGEDFVFFVGISENGTYACTSETIMKIRRFNGSAMSNLRALERGYAQIIAYGNTLVNIRQSELLAMAEKIRQVMFKSYLRRGKVWSAFLVFFRGVKA